MAASCTRLRCLLTRISNNRFLFSKFRRCCSSDYSADILASNSDKFSGEEDLKFKNSGVQRLLKRIIERNVDLDKIFKPRKEPLKLPTYDLFTDAEVAEAEEEFMKEALKRLEMTPVMHERKEINLVLSNDSQIDGHDESNFVFTDISTSLNEKNRRIVVRETNGVLREATWDERERMNFIYLPKEGQSFQLPPMLTDQNLPDIFEQMPHADALDLVSVQCQPDSPDYLRVHERVYDDVDRKSLYHLLESTRHYGGMLYFLVSHKRINGLLIRMMSEERMEDAADVIRLLHVIHPDSELAKASENSSSYDLLMAYAQKEGVDEIVSILADDNLEQKGEV